jgi:hypothetical protein
MFFPKIDRAKEPTIQRVTRKREADCRATVGSGQDCALLLLRLGWCKVGTSENIPGLPIGTTISSLSLEQFFPPGPRGDSSGRGF